MPRCRASGVVVSWYPSGVTSRIAVIAIDALDPDRVAQFWCEVLGWVVIDRDEDGLSIGPAVVPPMAGPGPTIDVFAVPERKTVKNRLHLDLRAEGPDRAEELTRLLALGARPVDVGQDPAVSWTVLADPEGNEFCLLGSTVAEGVG
jgi:catechol 2,3-dioxygenase-like lactoylglutathione lyase family enzyme